MPSFTNQATLSYRGNVTISNIVTGELVAVLSATKTALSERYGADDILTYVISIVNSGPAPYTGLTMTDDLGAYTYGTGTLTPVPTYVDGSLRYFVNGVLQATPAPTADAPLTVPGIAVPAGGNALLIYETRVNSFAPLDTESTVTNTATLSGAGLTTPVQAASTVNARAAAYLTIGKALSPATVAENGTLTYTFTIQNYGNTAAAETDNVTVSDTFSPILKAISVTYNGVASTGKKERSTPTTPRPARSLRLPDDHGTRRFADARCRYRRRRCHPRHQYTDRDRNSLSTSPVPNERCC